MLQGIQDGSSGNDFIRVYGFRASRLGVCEKCPKREDWAHECLFGDCVTGLTVGPVALPAPLGSPVTP